MWNPEAWYVHGMYWHPSIVTLASPSSRPHPHKNCPIVLVDKDSGAQRMAFSTWEENYVLASLRRV
jgi:hypothetical protein